MQQIQLSSSEVAETETLLAEILSRYDASDAAGFLTDAPVWSHRLPLRLRSVINEWRLTEADDGVFVVSGLPIADACIGPTPPSLDVLPDPSPTQREETYLVLLGAMLGDLIAWGTQQSGRVIHDLFPIRDHQDMQLGTGCRELLTLHTEDAFHPLRGDYLAMLCLRNPQQVPTMLASIDALNLDEATKRLLREPLFTILPDESHRGVTGIVESENPTATRIDAMLSEPEKIAVMFGGPERDYLRLDAYFMPTPDDEAGRRALQTLVQEIERCTFDLVLQPGDVCIMDNFRVVHGRRPFAAQFDGTDRWLKRVLVARDLRKSVHARAGTMSRVIN